MPYWRYDIRTTIFTICCFLLFAGTITGNVFSFPLFSPPTAGLPVEDHTQDLEELQVLLFFDSQNDCSVCYLHILRLALHEPDIEQAGAQLIGVNVGSGDSQPFAEDNIILPFLIIGDRSNRLQHYYQTSFDSSHQVEVLLTQGSKVLLRETLDQSSDRVEPSVILSILLTKKENLVL